MSCRRIFLGVVVAVLAGCAGAVAKPDAAGLRASVEATETAFAATMANRDFEGFRSFLSDEAVFYVGERVLRGRERVAAEWRAYFEGPRAPFSWAPASVEVLESGDLALSSGPVFDPAGKQIATFTSIWRQEKPGVWRIVFDKGCS